jgi:hypothetical protein
MERVIEQRLEMPTQLVQDVTLNLERLDADFDTPGLPSLNEAVCNLAERLENCSLGSPPLEYVLSWKFPVLGRLSRTLVAVP